MLHSIRARISLIYVLLLLAVISVLAIYLSGFLRNTYISELQTRLGNEAQLIGSLVSPMLLEQVPPLQIDNLTKDLANQIEARVTIISSDGVVQGESWQDPAKMDNHSDRPEVIQAAERDIGSSIRYSDTIGYDMLYVAVPIKDGNSIIGYSRVALSLESIQDNITRLQRALIAATVITAILAVILAIWIADRTTRPLNDLIKAANQVAAGDLDSRLIPSSHDEIGQLTVTFNEMADQLKTRLEELESERARVEAVLNGMSDGVVIVDLENRINLLNPAVGDMFEMQTEHAVGRSIFEFIRHHQVAEMIERCRESEISQSISIEGASRQIFLLATASPLGSGQQGDILLLFRNLTRMRRLETIRQDFISNLSHELRTPLASLKALSETLSEGALDDPPAARRFLSRMETELDALSQMVEELLELSRIESGRVPLKIVPTSPHYLAQQAYGRLAVQAEREKLTIELDVPEALPDVLVDPIRIVQVFVNLMHNAIKFTSKGGKIIVSGLQQKKMIVISVSDSGIGIPPEDLPRIFERFYKTDRARSTGGTGLGLAIARHLVEAHGGTIWAESKEGEGSTFYFTLPLVDQV